MNVEERRAREVASRAIRRLNILEWVILLMAALFALGAGALVALMVRDLTGAPFRIGWAVASLLLFIVPAVGVHLRDRREGRREPSPDREG